MKLSLSLPLSLLLACSNVLAASPYAGEQGRDIKALSMQDVDAYLAGQGMGFAKAAELNGYAGPKHVLELAGELSLTNEQRTRTQALFASMQSAASSLGSEIVDEERKLDHLFASQTVRRSLCGSLATRIGDAAGATARDASASAPGAGGHPDAGTERSLLATCAATVQRPASPLIEICKSRDVRALTVGAMLAKLRDNNR